MSIPGLDAGPSSACLPESDLLGTLRGAENSYRPARPQIPTCSALLGRCQRHTQTPGALDRAHDVPSHRGCPCLATAILVCSQVRAVLPVHPCGASPLPPSSHLGYSPLCFLQTSTSRQGDHFKHSPPCSEPATSSLKLSVRWTPRPCPSAVLAPLGSSCTFAHLLGASLQSQHLSLECSLPSVRLSDLSLHAASSWKPPRPLQSTQTRSDSHCIHVSVIALTSFVINYLCGYLLNCELHRVSSAHC